MNHKIIQIAIIANGLLILGSCAQPSPRKTSAVPKTVLREAPALKMPGPVDCNSPAHWSGQTLIVFNSNGSPTRSVGPDLFHLGPAKPSPYNNKVNGGRWIEATFKAPDGALYGWYHNEPGGLCPGTTLTAPRIGAVKSLDDGATFTDLGIVLEARPGTLRCDALNRYFAGGNGDFCVNYDPKSRFFYFFFGSYAGDVSEQGVAVARMAWADRDAPKGKVWKWHNGGWGEQGLGGRLTPIFPARIAWERADADAFWGPSIHWNTHLKLWVMLLNRTKDKPGWPQEGIYVSFNKTLSDQNGWSEPNKIHERGSWYPQVIGLDAKAHQTDKLAGCVARFFMGGRSSWEIVFLRPGEELPETTHLAR